MTKRFEVSIVAVCECPEQLDVVLERPELQIVRNFAKIEQQQAKRVRNRALSRPWPLTIRTVNLRGTHILLDLYGCIPLSTPQWEQLLRRAVKAANVELLTLQVKEFEPEGLTAFCLLSESHLSVHTWPEDDYVGIDLFTCGDNCRPQLAIDLLVDELSPASSQIRNVKRGDHSHSSLASTQTTLNE